MIQNIKLYVVLNGFGSYALLVKMWTRSGCYRASVPIPDADSESLKKIRALFSSIRPNLIGLNEEDWISFDSFINQLDSKGRNIHPSLSLALSIACARAATQGELWKLRGAKKWFPYIVGTVALGKDWKEFMVIPHRERTVMDAFETLLEIWNTIGGELGEQGVLRGTSARGAWLSDLNDLEMLYFLGQIAKDWNIKLGINIGGDSLWDGKSYNYRQTKGTVIRNNPGAEEQMNLLTAITEQYKIWYMQDPFHSSDIMSHAQLSHKLDDAIVSGSDLYRGLISRMKRCYKLRATNAITVDPSHLSSISQLSEIAEFTKGKGMKLILSRFRHETADNWLSDLSVAFGADMLKIGIMGGDNISKFSRLLEMWEDAPSPRMGLVKAEG